MAATSAQVDPAEGLDPRDRFEAWRDLIGLTRDCEATSPHADRFSAELRRSELGPVTFLGTSFPSARFKRSDARVRRSDPGVFHLTLVLNGELTLSRDAMPDQTFRTGEMTLLDSSRSYDLRALGARTTEPDRPRVDAVGIDFPTSLLPMSPFQLRKLLGRSYRVGGGSGALVSDFLLSLDRQSDVLGPAAAARLGPLAVDLVSVWLAEELDGVAALSPTARRRVLVEQVRAFVRRNLHDPELTPSVIAAAHHISVSYLHRVFSQESPGETVAGWIRRQRLAKAHRDLADPVLRATPIHTVAARWGMPRPDDFSRAFRSVYGLSPRDHRRQSLTARAE
ncbi:helix-turn-helix domain-containing protein [Streptomyces sp. TLI_171]|uniref:helix-turn-helix domain-containing protein n=1 Tax=Streptomyces sp. TLI_171 TaxID=1938859 RepID=UPI000C17E183|nr:helix-turn-helix domain-containing protein [Streptomyces sp. TLI_171]